MTRRPLLGPLLAAGLVFRALNALQGSMLLPGRARTTVLRLMGVSASTTAFVSHSVDIGGPNLTLRAGAFVNRGAILDAEARIDVGIGVHIGPGVIIATSSHHIGPPRLRAGAEKKGEVSIGAGSWIGAGAIVLPGVDIAEGTVVAAGAVVAADTEKDCLYGGVPARVIRRL